MKPAYINPASISFVFAFALLLSPLAQSTTLAPLSLAQLTSSAANVVHAECTGNQTLWRDGEIWTVTSFRVLETWKGNSPQEIQVWMIGGALAQSRATCPERHDSASAKKQFSSSNRQVPARSRALSQLSRGVKARSAFIAIRARAKCV